MKKLTLFLLIFQSVCGISQVDYLNYSNLMVFEPSSIENNRIEICEYFIATYNDLTEELQSQIDNNIRHKDRDIIESEIEILANYTARWKDVYQKHAFPDFLSAMKEMKCYQVSSRYKNYNNSEIEIQENKLWKNDERDVLEIIIPIEKAPGDGEWVKVQRNTRFELNNPDSEGIASFQKEKSFLFQIDNEQVMTERLPSNLNLLEEDRVAVFTIEFEPHQYELISVEDGERIEMEYWKEVECE